MKDDDIKKMFDQSGKTQPDPQARQRAIAAAMAEFKNSASEKNAKNSAPNQGSATAARPTDIHDHSRKKNMKTSTKQWAFGSLAAASVLMFASFIALRTPNQFDLDMDSGLPHDPREQHSAKDFQDQAQANQGGQSKKDLQKISATNAPEGSAEQSVAERLEARGENITVDAESAPETVKPDVLARAKPAAPTSVAQGERLQEESFAGSMADHRQQPAGKLAGNAVQSFAGDRTAAQKLSIAPLPRPYRPEPMPTPAANDSRERFEAHDINPVKLTKDEPVSTFSIDVDTASYSFARRKLNVGVLPKSDAVRIEEFINYFDYDYPNEASEEKPFSTHVLVGESPWKAGNKLLHIGIKGYDIKTQPKSNLVFLLDVSGSMASPDKLPLVKQSIGLLLDTLRPDDTIAIAVYAGAAGTVLEPTPVKDKQKIIAAMDKLQAGGSTAGAAGIELAYQLAEANYKDDAVNRIILATDGDFNVGINNPDRLKDYVEKKREKGIFLSVLGFGEGNYYDQLMQSLAQNGNGVAAYIDSLSEAQKVLVTEATSSLFPIAKDVKIQVEFNPATVAEYRLIGYETRHLAREDFNNDKVDAGDIGSGHTVTAIYEITPVGSDNRLIDESRYEKKESKESKASSKDEYALVKLRYKLPKEDTSKLLTQVIPVKDTVELVSKPTNWQQREFMFSAAVAGFAQLLKDDKYMGDWNYDKVIETALASRGEDKYGYRNEFVQLVRKAKISKPM